MNGSEEFFRFREASARCVRDDGLCAVCIRTVGIGEERTVLVGEQESRNDGVHAELRAELGCQLGCHIAGIVADGCLGGAVTYHARQRTESGFGAEVNDGALLVLCHDVYEHHGGEYRTEEVQVYDFAECVHIQVEHGLVRSDGGARHIAACGVQQHVDGAETFEYGFLVFFQHFLVQYVGYEEQRFGLLVKFGFQFPARFFHTVQNYDFGSLLGQIVRDVSSQNTATACQDDYLVFDVE